MPLWYLETHDSETGLWEPAGVESDEELARAVRDELRYDGFTVRARERGDLSPAEAVRLDRADKGRTMDQHATWRFYHCRADDRLKRLRRTAA